MSILDVLRSAFKRSVRNAEAGDANYIANLTLIRLAEAEQASPAKIGEDADLIETAIARFKFDRGTYATSFAKSFAERERERVRLNIPHASLRRAASIGLEEYERFIALENPATEWSAVSDAPPPQALLATLVALHHLSIRYRRLSRVAVQEYGYE